MPLGWVVVDARGVLNDVVFMIELGVEMVIDDKSWMLFTKALFTNLISFAVNGVRVGD